jgi:glycosyltransferase involved in cell wall biosynthesis
MRIAIVTWSRRRLGGAEEYIARIVPDLVKAGHDLAFWHSVDEPTTVGQIPLPAELTTWCATDLGQQKAIAAFREWRPEIVFAHGLENPRIEAEILKVAPGVFFAHGYYGTCISGSKMTSFPRPEPCARQFGAKCLLNFYPRRCGGLNPQTMWREYRRQSQRLSLLSRYRAIVTLSRHMADEYIKHGFDADRVHHLPSPLGFDYGGNGYAAADNGNLKQNGSDITNEVQLTFLGRMHYSKGCSTLLAALPLIAEKLKKSICLTFGGDGPERVKLERLARRLNGNSSLRVEFPGWLSQQAKDELLERSDLLVVPSLWPEPFGMVGLEACMHGVPVVAFDSGGVREWLHDGVNGFLAAGDPPTAAALAAAVVKSLQSPASYIQLKRGAFEIASRLNMQTHVGSLLNLFEQVVSESRN